MAATETQDIYADCRHIKRTAPEIKVDQKIAEAVGTEFRTLPSFEKSLYDYVNRQHYSLQRNQLLSCRWIKYKQNIEHRVFAPFQFPDKRDLHFYNGGIRFLPDPEISIFRRTDHRMKLRPGPGVDSFGQMPIPLELQMRRGRSEVEDVGKRGSRGSTKDLKKVEKKEKTKQ